jgi:hypothetical protein
MVKTSLRYAIIQKISQFWANIKKNDLYIWQLYISYCFYQHLFHIMPQKNYLLFEILFVILQCIASTQCV